MEDTNNIKSLKDSEYTTFGNIKITHEDVAFIKTSDDSDNIIKKGYNKISQYTKYGNSPFIDKHTHVPITRKKEFAKDTSNYIINKDSGEVSEMGIFQSKVVDNEQFAKIYISAMGELFSLPANALKVFSYILSILTPNKDKFMFVLNDCIKFTTYKTKSSVFDGLAILLEKDIIARSENHFIYFINPKISFNGSRLVLVKEYKRKSQQALAPNQLHLGYTDEQPTSEEN